MPAWEQKKQNAARFAPENNPFSAGKCARNGCFSELPASERKGIQSKFNKLAKTFIFFAAEEASGK